MNSTNRVLNRGLIFLVGLIIFVLGAASVALGAVPSIASAWGQAAPAVQSHVTEAMVATPLLSTGSSWLWLALIALLTVIGIVLIAFIVRQGGGHTRELFRDQTTEHGSTVVRTAVAADAIKDALRDRDDLIASSVSTYDVNGITVLKLSATARRGVSPKDIHVSLEGTLRALDNLLGFEVPALIQISGGLRTRAAKATRLT
jgi:hypothetical protein